MPKITFLKSIFSLRHEIEWPFLCPKKLQARAIPAKITFLQSISLRFLNSIPLQSTCLRNLQKEVRPRQYCIWLEVGDLTVFCKVLTWKYMMRGVETTGKKKRLKRCNLHCFLLVPRTKQCYLRCFLTLAAPKSSQNIGIYDVFTTTRKANVAKTPLFATLWQHNMSEIVYFTVFLDHLFKNTGIYSVFRKHMHKTS